MKQIPEGHKTCTSDNVALRQPAGKHYVPPRDSYIPSCDNPQDPIRPGADDHLKHKSLPMQAQATYRRHHI